MKKCLIFVLLLVLASATQAQDNLSAAKAGRLKLTIRYLFATDNTEAATPYVNDTMAPDDPYMVVSPVIAGYRADRDTVRGTMPAFHLTDSVLYYQDAFKVTLLSEPEQGGTVSGEGVYAYEDEVTVTAEPNNGYEFVNWTQYDDEVCQSPQYVFRITEDVELVAHFNQLPPTVGQIEAPQGICADEALELTAPEVSFADEQGWQMSPNNDFQEIEAYEGQNLDANYNGWKLRYYASNAASTVYSNAVDIKVYTLEPELTGDAYLCTMQKGTYTASKVSGADLKWTVTDETALITESESGKKITVTWITAGEHTVTLSAENNETGCSATVEMKVTVQSFINPADINELVVKKHDGKDYILIYPNPKDTYKYQWYKDGAPISGANGQYLYQHNGLDAGAYKVYLSLNADANGNLFGGAFTNEYTVKAASTAKLYPNPAQANERIRLMGEEGEENIVRIYSIDGRLLHTQAFNGNQTTLDLDLPAGMYLVRINNETTEKLIIE